MEHWDDIIYAERHWKSNKPTNNIEYVIADILGGKKTLRVWLKKDPENRLYSLFGRGKVPIDFLVTYKDCGIQTILDNEDKQRLFDHEQAEQVQDDAKAQRSQEA